MHGICEVEFEMETGEMGGAHHYICVDVYLYFYVYLYICVLCSCEVEFETEVGEMGGADHYTPNPHCCLFSVSNFVINVVMIISISSIFIFISIIISKVYI